MAAIPIRDIPGENLTPNGTELIVVDNGVSMRKAVLNDAVAPKVAAEIANLNLGTAAQADTSDFATAEQGTTADTAVQPGDLAAFLDQATFNPTSQSADVFDSANHTYDNSASGLSATDVQEAIDEVVASIGNGGMAVSRAWVIANYHPMAEPDALRTDGYAVAGDGGGALYKKVGGEPAHAGKFSITLADGTTVVWYEIAESVLTERMFGAPCDGDWSGGGTDATAILQAWASCPVSNVKRFTGVSKATDAISWPIDTNLKGSGDGVGIDFSAATSITGFSCMKYDGSANLVQIENLGANVTKGATSLTFASAPSLVPGDRFCIYNPTDHSWTAGNVAGSRSYYRAGEWCRVRSVSGSTVLLDGPTWAGYTAANVVVYRLRGAGPKLRDFRVKPPYLQVSAINIDCAIAPFIQGVNRTDGGEYCGIELSRCLDLYVNNNQFQGDASGTPNDEYALCISNCTGGEIHGSYAAQRHGIAFGSGSYAAGVPCRSVKVYADTYSSLDVPSLDFGHGSTEGLQAIGGTHNGLGLGGKNHKFRGLRSRKGASPSGISGLTVNGTEIYGGTFEFEDCYLEQLASATTTYGPVYIAVQAAATDPIVFIFKNCVFDTHPSEAQCIRINANSSPVSISVVVENPLIRGGAGLTRFILLNTVSGTWTCPLLVCRGVKGLGNSIPRIVFSGAIGLSEVHMDPQKVASLSVPGVSGANSLTQAVSFPWAYPAGVVPYVACQTNSASIGGKRMVAYAASVSNTGFLVTAMVPDGTNMTSTVSGGVQWKATVD